MRGSWRPNRTETYWPPHFYGYQRFFPVLLGCSTGGLGTQPLSVLVFSTASPTRLIPNWLIGGLPYHILSATDWISGVLNYIIVQHPPSSCGRHKLHSFNPPTVKATLCYSSTGCTCCLHRCISYFDSPDGS